MRIRKEWLYFAAASILSWAGMAQAVTNLTFSGITPQPVVYDPEKSYTVKVNLTASQQTPTIVAQTSGTVNTCRIESVARTLNTASISFSTHGATNATTTCRIIVNHPGEGNIEDATGTLNVNIGKADQAVTLVKLDNFIAGETRELYLESTGSANPITLSSSTSTICKIDTSKTPWTVSALQASTCTFYVRKTGDANYNDYPKPNTIPSQFTLSIGKGNTTISFDNPPSLLTLPYNQSYNLTVAKSGSSKALTGGTTTQSVCTVVVPVSSTSPSTFTILGNALGTCTINANVLGDTNYNDGSNSIAIQIVKADQRLTLTRTPTTNLEINQSATVTVTSSHPGTTADPASPIVVSVLDPTLCSIAGTGPYTVTAIKGGTCRVQASQEGNGLYNPGSAILPIAINKPAQTVSGSGNTALEVAQTAFLTITPGNSINPPYLSVEDGTVCRVTTQSRTSAKLEGLRGGTCIIRAEQAGDENYRDFTIKPVFTVTINKGTVPIQYTYVPVVSVGKSDEPKASPEAFVTYASTTPTICSVSTDAVSQKQIVTGLHVGQCKITATRPENAYYIASGPIEQTFAVNQGAQTITPAVPTSVTLGSPITISANSVSGSGQQLTVSASPSGICSLAPLPPANNNHAQATLTSSTPGDCNITFVQNGTPDYAPASLTVVTKVIGSQTISFAAPDPIALNGGPLALQASASSGLPVSFASTTPTVCNVAGNQLALLKVGTCGLTASQDGNAYYQAATPVSQNLTILPPTSNTTVISSANPILQRRALTLTASVSGAAPTGNVSFLANGVAITGCASVALQNGSASCTTSALKPGSHQIVASYSGDANNQGSQSPALTQRVQGLDWLAPMLDLLLN